MSYHADECTGGYSTFAATCLLFGRRVCSSVKPLGRERIRARYLPIPWPLTSKRRRLHQAVKLATASRGLLPFGVVRCSKRHSSGRVSLAEQFFIPLPLSKNPRRQHLDKTTSVFRSSQYAVLLYSHHVDVYVTGRESRETLKRSSCS